MCPLHLKPFHPRMYFVGLAEIGHMTPERKELYKSYKRIINCSLPSLFELGRGTSIPTQRDIACIVGTTSEKMLLYVLYNVFVDMISL